MTDNFSKLIQLLVFHWNQSQFSLMIMFKTKFYFAPCEYVCVCFVHSIDSNVMNAHVGQELEKNHCETVLLGVMVL